MKQTELKRTKGLTRKKGLKPVSEKQKAKNELWSRITDMRAWEEGMICQWCGKEGARWPGKPTLLDGHHIIKRRYNIHTKENCYICHRFPCHREIEDNNIDVRQYPNREAWLRSKNDLS